MQKIKIIIIFTVIASFLISFLLYPLMPEKMASHWNIQGEVDNYTPKTVGLFLMPVISVFMLLLFFLIPKIDPLKENIKKFRKYFDVFVMVIIIFLFYIYILTILWNFGWKFNMGRLIAPAFGVMFFYAGVLMQKSKRNWFIGIRTPWTLSSENVWDKTHELGARLFKALGLVAFLGVFLPVFIFYFVLVFSGFSVIYAVVYSYFEYQNEKNKSNKKRLY